METKLGIFDPPTSAELEKIFEAHDSIGDGSNITADNNVLFHPILRGGVKGRTPKPNMTGIAALFGTDSLATTQKTSPLPTDQATQQTLWGGIQTTYLSRIDPCPVSKAVAVSYLYGDPAGTAPDRYACVNVAFGGLAIPI